MFFNDHEYEDNRTHDCETSDDGIPVVIPTVISRKLPDSAKFH